MKWRGSFCFFLLSFYFITVARGQLITFSVKNERLEKVFLLIEQQSGHHFIYSNEALAGAKPITLTVANEQLTSVLEKCFAGQPLQYNLHEKNITVKAKPQAVVERVLSGKVINESGLPVQGISVAVKNTNLITATDINGIFIFDHAPESATLFISGAEIESQEITVKKSNNIEVVIRQRVNVLDETLVIAYGKTSRRYTVGTSSGIKSSEIEKQPVSNSLLVLPGRISGLQVSQNNGAPGSYVTVRLRGQNSIANGNDPLFIIDGVPFPSVTLSGSFGGATGVNTSPLNTLNPADIESIDVLKDAEATAIYGSRGANGVILITTKKGYQGKPSLNIRYYKGLGSITRRIELLNTPEYIAMRKEAFANDGVSPTAANARDLLLWDTIRYTDWQDVMIGNTMKSDDVNLQYAGGTAETQFRISAGYHKETTVFPGDFFMKKFSGSLQMNHRSVDKKFLLSISSEYAYAGSELPMEDLTTQITLPPNAPAIYDATGKLNWENSTWNNPMALLNSVFEFKTDQFLSNVSMAYQVLPGLSAKLNGGFTYLNAKDLAITPGSNYDPALNATGIARFATNTIKTLIAEPQISYDYYKKQISATILAGATLQSSTQYNIAQAGTGYTNDATIRSLRAAPSIINVGENDINYRYSGLFTRITADYKKRYLFSATIRRDGSSRYGPENRFANFWSLGAGWIFSEEKFLKKQRLLSFGKLKLSAGLTGNDQIGDYKYLDLYSPLSNAYLGVTPYVPTQLYNPLFGWEKVNKKEAGLDLGFIKDRILITVNYYYNTTTNQLVSYPLPTMSGFSGITRNIPAIIRNTGWEFEVNTVNLKSRFWEWRSSANLTIPKNELVEYEGLASSTYANRYVIGQSLFIAKAYQNTGVDPQLGIYTFTDFNRDNLINNPNDRQVVVFTGQRFFGGLQNTIKYKRLSLSILFQFVSHPHSENYLSRFGRPGNMTNQPKLILGRWQRPGDISSIQRFTNSSSSANTAFSNYRASDVGGYGDASYIRLRNLSFTVDLLKPELQKKGIKSCQVFLQGHNLVTITAFEGLDPETKSLLPPVRMLTAGFQLTF